MEEKSMAPLTDYAVVHSTLFLVDWSFDWWQRSNNNSQQQLWWRRGD
jgi:hypothetical protein